MQAPPQQSSIEPVPVGSHKARCFCVCDIGTHKITYPGKPTKDVRQIRIAWELPECRMEFEDDGKKIDKPRVIGKDYTFSTYSESALSKHVTPWMGSCGDDFDFTALLMEPCLLNVVHKTKGEKTYANIGAIMQLPSGVVVPELENEVIYYSIQENGKELPQAIIGNERMKWLQDKIESSNEWARMNHAGQVMGLSQGQMDAHDDASSEQFNDDGTPFVPVDADPENLPQGTVDGDDGNNQPFGPGGDDIPF